MQQGRTGILALIALGAAVMLHAADRTTPVAGGHISYEVRGGGRPLVFVHGWSCDRTYWREQMDEFAKRHRVVAIDLGGHGDRRLAGRISGLVWVDVYKELGEKREFDVAAFTAPFEADFAGTTRGFVRGMFAAGAPRSLVDRISEDMAGAPRDIALAAMRSAVTHQPHVLVALAELKLPVIAINPESPASNEASLARHGVRLVTVAETGHFPMLERPREFNRRLGQALEMLAQEP
jgi:pimeloyl-ACP methyl ester carboxylesterase